jgi:hypothetical protein
LRGDKELKVVSFVCDWFDSIHGIQHNKYGIVKIKHNSKLPGNNDFILAHQAELVYYLNNQCQKLAAWRIVYKVNPHEWLYTPTDVAYHFDDEQVDEIYEEEELPTTFVDEIYQEEHLCSFFILYMMLTFLCLLPFSSWLDTSFDGRGHHRQVNQILGNLLRLHYPGLVTKGGHSEPATTWRDYARAPNAIYGNAQGVVRHAFWVSSYMFINSFTFCNT